MRRRRRGKKKLRLIKAKRNNITSSSPAATEPSPWIELPLDVVTNILHRVRPMEILESAQKVCTTWHSVCGDPSLWRVIHFDNPDRLIPSKNDMVCRRAVDRSQGELTHISIVRFCTDELLQYISERSSHLKYLRLGRCKNVTSHGLMTSVKNFPLLEELRIFFMTSIGFVDLETIGVSCPMLKFFTFYNSGYDSKDPFMETDEADKHARAIGKNMPNLCHLSLFGNMLSNKGLEAILDGCPNLESLDLRECFYVDLECHMGRRCLMQIKELRQTRDSKFYRDENYLFDRILDCYSSEDEFDDCDGYGAFYDDGDYGCDDPYKDLYYGDGLATSYLD